MYMLSVCEQLSQLAPFPHLYLHNLQDPFTHAQAEEPGLQMQTLHATSTNALCSGTFTDLHTFSPFKHVHAIGPVYACTSYKFRLAYMHT